jgi:hypothetical protein
MRISTENLLNRCLRALALRGYGWKRRKQRESLSCRIEWQDPVTGHWYTEKTALRLLKGTILAQYDKPSRNRDNFRH